MDGWIHIPRWDDFQHYKKRDPPWIKDYRSQLDNHQYLELSLAQRGLLHDLRLLYLVTHKNVPLKTQYLSSRLRAKVFQKQLEALNDAGFIRLRASTLLDQSREELEDIDRDPEALQHLQQLAVHVLGERLH
jgi:hypothetical protein